MSGRARERGGSQATQSWGLGMKLGGCSLGDRLLSIAGIDRFLGGLWVVLGLASVASGQVVSYGPGFSTISFTGAQGYACVVQRSTNLVDWVDLWRTNTPCQGVFGYCDQFDGLGGEPRAGFYRVAPQRLKALLPVPPIIYNTFYDDADPSVVTSNNIVNTLQNLYRIGWVSAVNAAGAKLWVWIDDGWQASSRDSSGWLAASPAKFPSGLASVVSIIHSSNCLAGIYTSWGPTSCFGFPGTDEAHVLDDMMFFATNGFDGIKIDDCNEPWNFTQRVEDRYTRNKVTRLNAAALAVGRPMVLDLNCPELPPYPWYMPYTANIFQLSWGVQGMSDTQPDDLGAIVACASMSQRTNLITFDGRPVTAPAQVGLIGPGHYPRWSAIVSNCRALSRRSGIVFTAMTPQPIQTGNWQGYDLAEGMTNVTLLKIHQDPAGRPGLITYSNNCAEVWVRPLGGSGHTNAVAVVNWGTDPARLTLDWQTLGLYLGTAVSMVDVLDGTNSGTVTDFSITVPPSSVYLYRFDHP